MRNFKALDTVATVLNAKGLVVGTAQGTFPIPNKSNRQLVIDALIRRPGATMSELEKETGLTTKQLKAAIYAQDSRDLFVTKKGNGRAKYYLKESNVK